MGQVLYTHYVIGFLCSGLILFLAAIAAVALNSYPACSFSTRGHLRAGAQKPGVTLIYTKRGAADAPGISVHPRFQPETFPAGTGLIAVRGLGFWWTRLGRPDHNPGVGGFDSPLHQLVSKKNNMFVKSHSIKKIDTTHAPLHTKTGHTFHLVDPSPWPFLGGSSILALATGAVMYLHKFKGGPNLFTVSLFTAVFSAAAWFRDIVRESALEGNQSAAVRKGFRLGVILFIVSEVMFFFALFWTFFHTSFSPVFDTGGVWSPRLTQTVQTLGPPLLVVGG